MRAPALWLLALLWPALSAAHPVHVSIAEARFDPATERLEVAQRVTPEDLERALERFLGRPAAAGEPALEAHLARFLANVWTAEPAAPRDSPAGAEAGDPDALTWIGWEAEGRYLWLYFELDLPGGLEGALIGNRFLLDVEPQQVNTVNLEQGERRQTLTFTRAAPVRRVAFP